MKNDEAINVFEAYLATGHVPYPYELREASRMAISALKGEMPLPEDTVLFNKGVEEGKEQMMKEAVEGDITNAGGEFGYDVAAFRFDENHTYTVLLPHEEGRKHGDKVELIIVKGD